MTRYSFNQMFDFTRDSAATYWDAASGEIKEVEKDVVRFEAEGILMEDASTNHALQSSPDSSTTAQSAVRLTNLPGKHGFRSGLRIRTSTGNTAAYTGSETEAVALATGDMFTVTALVEIDPSSNLFLVRADAGGGAYLQIRGDITDDSTWIYGGDGTYTDNRSLTATNLTGSLWRLEGTCEVKAAWTLGRVSVGPNTATTDDEYIDLYGLQVEVLPFATSYIPTDGAAVTREKDNLIAKAGPLGTAYQTGGSWLIECKFNREAVLSGSAVFITADRSFLYQNPNLSSPGHTISYDGTSYLQLSSSVSPSSMFKSHAMSWQNSGDRVLSIDGKSNTGVADADGFGTGLPRLMDEFSYGHIKRVIYWEEPLSAADLEAMTDLGPFAATLPEMPKDEPE